MQSLPQPQLGIRSRLYPRLSFLLGCLESCGEMDQPVETVVDQPSLFPSSPRPTPATTSRKRKVVAKSLQKTLSKTSMLARFLPTGTLLTFEMLLPPVSGDGSCSPASTTMMHVLLGLCTISCFFFHFTDSFHGPDGKVYYGFVTPRGLAVFKPGLGVEVPKDDRYRMGFVDLVHAAMAVMVFSAIALSDHRVTNCLFPGRAKEMDEVMESFPLMVGVVCSGLFLVFPATRSGVGCTPS
ncbi:protein DMP8-like [Phoenix dactylifera]|uniref:Protein DMP8-like n=1 Tax=Phoenix dactylifera TaxID=42345 RepID=A0A8B7BLQ7_PHODC|nr:protein DMP8-like [Phoenix dactylifera]